MAVTKARKRNTISIEMSHSEVVDYLIIQLQTKAHFSYSQAQFIFVTWCYTSNVQDIEALENYELKGFVEAWKAFLESEHFVKYISTL